MKALIMTLFLVGCTSKQPQKNQTEYTLGCSHAMLVMLLQKGHAPRVDIIDEFCTEMFSNR